nr:beta-hexosaminidase 3 [Tanacetum cinerariifolium]
MISRRYGAWFPRLNITNRLHRVIFLTGVGYPVLCPSKNYREPLDVISDCTFKLINGVLSVRSSSIDLFIWEVMKLTPVIRSVSQWSGGTSQTEDIIYKVIIILL